MPLPILGALLSIAALCASFVYTAGYRFLKELIEIASKYQDKFPKKCIKISSYYIFSDFILDYTYGGSLYALILILFSQYLVNIWKKPNYHCLLSVGWIIIFSLLVFFWIIKVIKNREQLYMNLTQCLISFIVISFIIFLEVILSISSIFSNINDFSDIVKLIIPKVFALFCWLVFGFIWKPFSSFAEIKKVIK